LLKKKGTYLVHVRTAGNCNNNIGSCFIELRENNTLITKCFGGNTNNPFHHLMENQHNKWFSYHIDEVFVFANDNTPLTVYQVPHSAPINEKQNNQFTIIKLI